MSNQKIIIQLIREISGQANVLTIPRIFIKMTKDIKTALFLSQCIYWSDKSSRDDGFFYKKSEEWEEETGLSRHELDRVKAQLADFIETKLMKANGAPTTHYRPNLPKIAQWIINYYTEQAKQNDGSDQMDLPENDNSDLPESDETDLQEIVKSLTQITSPTTTSTTDKRETPRKRGTPKTAGAGEGKSPKKEPQNTDQYQIATTLSSICNLDFQKNRGRLFREAKLFKIDELPQIRRDYSPGGPWYQFDWRGQKGEHPTPNMIRETWGTLKAKNGSAPTVKPAAAKEDERQAALNRARARYANGGTNGRAN